MTLTLSLLLSLATAYAAALAWLFRVQYVAVSARDALKEHREESEKQKAAVSERIERLENMVNGVERLAVSFEYLSEKFSTELKYFAERQADAQIFLKTQLSDIKQELGHVRANAAMAKEMASRGATKARVG